MTKFESTAAEFRNAEPSLRLELLMDYAQRLPELPEKYRALRDAGVNLVHECQAPVFLVVEVDGGQVHVFGDVPREAPTARGFTAILIDAFDGADPADVEQAPPDALHELGLDSLLGMQRTRGLSAIYRRIKDEVSRKAAA